MEIENTVSWPDFGIFGGVRNAPPGILPGDGVWSVFAAPLGEFGFAVEDVDGDVVGSVLLGGMVADGPAVGGVVAQSGFQ